MASITFRTEFAIGQWGKRQVNTLTKRGINYVSAQPLPDPVSGWANPVNAYLMEVNGTGKVLTWLEVDAIARMKVGDVVKRQEGAATGTIERFNQCAQAVVKWNGNAERELVELTELQPVK